jgi:Lrp/AsnC family transcriptional regulator for asnA, asnC and gidA
VTSGRYPTPGAERTDLRRIACPVLRIQCFGSDWPTDSLATAGPVGDDRTMAVTPKPAPVTLDAISKAIIEQLQEDGRRPYATIGKAVGLSEAAVRQRVQRLVESGVVQIVAVTDPLQVGFTRQAMIGIKAEGDLQALADSLAELAEVDYVVITAGAFDILVEVVCEDDEHLLEVLNQQMRTLPGVRTTETFVYLKLRKQLYNWGTR